MAGVEVTNLTFSYSRRGSNLENINMLVPKGTIYGLLGPSGCCKTTLLRCIVGRLKPREGTVKVFGFKPGTEECGIPGPNIGYMPQDLSLISQFTVRETLEYYAGFAQTPDANGHYNKGCNEKNLNQRIEFLLTLLDISQFEHVFTDRLSGGQKRRASLAVAMINDPPLLILDEPTVGVDPIVRDAIWSYLLEQSKNGLTIIVTTHYIEEAASAHNVGFMRQGRILAEGNPAVLMAQFRAPTLEHLFLMLSKKDDKTRTHESDGLCQVAMDGSVVSSSALDSFSQPPSAVVVAETVFSNGGSLIPNGGSYSAEHHSHHHSTLHNHHLVNHHHPHHHNNHQLPTLPPPDYSITTDCSRVSDVALDSFTGTTTATTADSSQTETNNNNNSTYANGANGNCCKSVITKSQHQYQEASTGALVTITKLETKTTNNSSTTATLTVPDSPILGPRRSKFNSVSGGSTRKHRGYSVHKQSDKVSSFQKVGVLCRKHRLRLFRRVPELVITMLLPALEVALFCLCMGRDPTAIQMAVCNQENPPFMSMVFLKSIDPDFIQLKYYDTPEQAIDSVRNADTYSAIVLAKNFTSSMQNFATKVYPNKMGLGGPGGGGGGTVDTATTLAKMLHSRMTMPVTTSTASLPLLSTSLGPENSGLLDTPPGSEMPTSTPLPMTAATAAAAVLSSTSTTTIAPGVSAIPIDLIDPSKLGSSPYEQDDSIIKIYYDGSNALHVNIIRRELFSAVFRFVDYLGKLVGATGIANQLPIKFEKPIYGNEKTDMIEFVGPGLMVFIVFFATMSITSMAFLSERREGTLERSLIVGMTPTEFIISQIINITFLLIVQIILTVVMGFWIFSFPMKGSYVLAVTMMFCQGLCGMTYGLMLSAICTNEMTALMLGAGSQLMFCFITGIFWPVDTMIPLLRYFSYMMPQTLPMESFRHILIRGFDLSRPAVLNGYFISIGWIIFFLVLAIVIFRFR